MRVVAIVLAIGLIGLGAWLTIPELVRSDNRNRIVSPFNTNSDGVMLKGYDPVTYFPPASTPERGSDRFRLVHDGTTYHFVSAGNRARFAAAPDRFKPQFGGFCSYGVRSGQKIDIDPTVYRIVDGRLFVQLDRATQALWLENEGRNITIADAVWPKVSAMPFERK